MSRVDRALVVGGSSGIGAACVELLAFEGWSVLVADLRAPEPEASVDASAVVDVRDPDDLAAVVGSLAAGEPIAGLVYTAGTGHVAPVESLEPRHWRLVLDVNLSGAFYSARAALPHMRRGGSLVFISSIDSQQPVSGLAHYCASKAALEALSRSLALELAPRGIRSNVVAPGPVRTPLMNATFERPGVEARFVSRTPLGDIAAPPQIAATVAFLLSPAAAWVTGARLAVDGGMSLREHPSMLELEARKS